MSITLGLLAHVDAGKTTLAEGMLYLSGAIRKKGRVDHGDAFLDINRLEKERGITIFSKQARMTCEGRDIDLVDTPGHVDFCGEMERVLGILDAAVLIIDANDGVSGHTRSLFRLLKEAGIRTYIFVNKMDICSFSHEAVMKDIRDRLGKECIDFSNRDEAFYDELSMHDEAVMEKLLEGDSIAESDIEDMIGRGCIVPCLFGAALRLEGISDLLGLICRTVPKRCFGDSFAAKVYKVGRDRDKARVTYMRITGGSLKVKASVKLIGADGTETFEKVNQIRLYNGDEIATVDEAAAGSLCGVTGLNSSYAGQGLGSEPGSKGQLSQPVLKYRITPAQGTDERVFLLKLKELDEEFPELCVQVEQESRQIYVGIMGEVQLEILKDIILERYGIEVSFDEGSVVYKETIKAPVEGVGHYEPLRHYAEVHLLLSPLPEGSGVKASVKLSEDELSRNWQRLILTHIGEKQHKGVLTGSELTDVKITLVAGRDHIKHTEGGDFRQATYRAIRQGLMKAESLLLEPFYSFSAELTNSNVGRFLTDVKQMCGEAVVAESLGDRSVVKGEAPVICMRGYRKTLLQMGAANISLVPSGYRPCHNALEVIEAANYDPDRDLENPSSSVFCSHGSGSLVEWDRVEDYMHLPLTLKAAASDYPDANVPAGVDKAADRDNTQRTALLSSDRGSFYDDKELMAIFKQTYGETKRRENAEKRCITAEKSETRKEIVFKKPKDTYLLVDGYNIIFAWEELSELSRADAGAARHKLMDILCNYQGYKKINVILVFDAYKVSGGLGERQRYNNIDVIYTKEAETADSYIERTSRELSKDAEVVVATSDGLEQLIIFGDGARRMPARELYDEIKNTVMEIDRKRGDTGSLRNRLGDYMNS